jgi:Ca2+-binding EF-hand superfamily protein
MKSRFLAFAGFTALALALPAAADHHGSKRGAQGPGGYLMKLASENDGAVTRADAEAAIAGQFALIDADGDGYITQDEMKAHQDARRAEMQERRAERAAARWAELDTDGDGRLSLAEYTAARIKPFDRIDANNDGVVTADEIEAMRAQARERRGQWRGRRSAE